MNDVAPMLKALVRPIASLTLHERNARRHDERNLKAVADSLAAFGQQKPIVVASDGVVLCGNGTLQAALRLGWTEIAANVMSIDSDDPKARALAIADNRSADLSTFDRDALLAEIDALKDTTDLSALGFCDADVQLLRRVASIHGFEAAEIEERERADPGRVDAVTAPTLPSGDRAPIQQMTFTLHDAQVELVKRALGAAIDAGPFGDTGCENSNGNALARLAQNYLDVRSAKAAEVA